MTGVVEFWFGPSVHPGPDISIAVHPGLVTGVIGLDALAPSSVYFVMVIAASIAATVCQIAAGNANLLTSEASESVTLVEAQTT